MRFIFFGAVLSFCILVILALRSRPKCVWIPPEEGTQDLYWDTEYYDPYIHDETVINRTEHIFN